MNLLFIFIMLYSSNFYIHHAPEKTSIGNILFSSIILQKLKIF